MAGRFIFIGYDYFLCVAEAFCEEGWQLTDAFPTDKTEIHADGRALKQFADKVGAVCHESVLKEKHLEVIGASEVDLVIVAGYPQKIAEKFLSKANFINIHPSYLPIGRGPWPQPHIVLNDGLGAGVTFHTMSSKLDEGPIICQETVDFTPNDTIDTLAFKQQLVAKKMAKDLASGFPQIFSNLETQGTDHIWWNLPIASDRRINWSDNIQEITRKIRAFSKHGTLANVNGETLLVSAVNGWCDEHQHKPGELIYDTSEGPLIAASDGYIHLVAFEPY